MLKTTVSQIKFILKFIFVALTVPCELARMFFEEEVLRVRICIAVFAIIYLVAEFCVISLFWGIAAKLIAIF